MNLREQAELDLAQTLESTKDFAETFTLVSPAGQEYSLSGRRNDIGIMIDPGTGLQTQGRTVVFHTRISTLKKFGAGDILKSSDKWLIRFHDEFFVVTYAPQDNTLGFVSLQAESIEIEEEEE